MAPYSQADSSGRHRRPRMSEATAAAKDTWWRQLARTYSGKLTLSVLNQVVGSGANFVLGLYLIRVLTPPEFGLYGIGIASCLLFTGIGNALFLTQMVVHFPDKHDNDRTSYAAIMLALVGLFSLIAVTLVGALIALLFIVGWSTESMSYFLLASGFAAGSSLLKNYFVRLAYSLKLVQKALAVNLGWASAVLLILLTGERITDAASALWLFSVANLAAILLGLIVIRLPLRNVRPQRMRCDFLEAFGGGRWALGGVSVTWLQSQSYILATTLMIGATGVALANAARMLITPFTFLLPAITQLLLPQLAELRNSDRQAMLRGGYLYTMILVGMAALYLLVLWVGARELIPLLVGERYSIEDILPLVIAWGSVLIFQLARDGASLIMQAIKAFRSLMIINAIAATSTILATVILTNMLGVIGAILSVGVGETMLAALLWYHVRNEVMNDEY